MKHRLNEMLSSLRNTNTIALLNVYIADGLPESEIARIEGRLGFRLADDIRTFYLQHNGLQIRWVAGETTSAGTSKQALDWNYFDQHDQGEDGALMILPLERMAESGRLSGKDRIFTLDAFSSEEQMVLRVNEQQEQVLALTAGDLDADIFSKQSSFDTYWSMIMHNHAYRASRKDYYQTVASEAGKTLQWDTTDRFHFYPELLEMQSIFPLCHQPGQFLAGINQQWKAHVPFVSSPLNKHELEHIRESHMHFLRSGGAGGSWKTLEVKGCLTGLYTGAEGRAGRQADLEFRRLSAPDLLKDIQMPFTGACGLYAPGADLSGADLSYSLLSDASLAETDFRAADLRKVDFSRADLRGADFRGADLRGADFECCNLRGADFRDTRLHSSRFPGALLDEVKCDIGSDCHVVFS